MLDRPTFHNNPCFVLFYFLVGSLIYDVGNAHPTVVFDLLQSPIGLVYDVGYGCIWSFTMLDRPGL
jgi:hypothetical protein